MRYRYFAYGPLSLSYRCDINIEGIVYESAEDFILDIERYIDIKPIAPKILYAVNRAKFQQNITFLKTLLKTNTDELRESAYADIYPHWFQHGTLGKVLTILRDDLRQKLKEKPTVRETNEQRVSAVYGTSD